MDYSLAKLSSEYDEINRDKSPTLNSLFICKKNGDLTYKRFLSPIIFESYTSLVKEGERENYLNRNPYIIYEYLKDIIDNEIMMFEAGYYTFYTTQGLLKYINSRVLDYYLFENEDNIPKYFLWNGNANNSNNDGTTGGNYNNLFEYMKFLKKHMTDTISNEQTSLMVEYE